jgi:pilus assembly protein Flp/PilA
MHIMRLLKEFLNSEDGATAVEYAVMLALIMMAVLGTVATLGTNTAGLWDSMNSDMSTHGLGS